MTMQINGISFRISPCSDCGMHTVVRFFYQQPAYGCRGGWLCLACVTLRPWFRTSDPDNRERVIESYARAQRELRPATPSPLETWLRRCFGPERWQRLEQGI